MGLAVWTARTRSPSVSSSQTNFSYYLHFFSTGISTDFKISARTDSDVSSIMRALLFSIRRCAQTSGKIAGDVLWHHEITAIEIRIRLRHPADRQRAARADAERNLRMASCFLHQCCHIIQNGVAHIHLTHLLHQSQQFFLVDHGIGPVKGIIYMAVAENIDAALVVGVAHADADEEAVKLGVRQHRRAGRTDRVLRGKDDKRLRQIIRSCRPL